MATLQDIERGLNAVHTVGQAQQAIGEALVALHNGYSLNGRTTGLSNSQRAALDRARVPLEQWFTLIKDLKPSTDYYTAFQSKRRAIDLAYIELAGIGATIQAKQTISFGNILVDSIKDAPRVVGSAIKGVTSTVGEAAGGLVGGLLSGLGPVFVVVLGLVLFFAVRSKVRA